MRVLFLYIFGKILWSTIYNLMFLFLDMCTHMHIVVDVIVLYSVFISLAIYVELLKIIFVFLRLQIEANVYTKTYLSKSCLIQKNVNLNFTLNINR